MTETLEITDLSYAAVDSKPIHVDWSELEWGEDFEFWEASENEDAAAETEHSECDDCGEPIYFDRDIEEWRHDTDEVEEDCGPPSNDEPVPYHTSWNGDGGEVGIEGPMMNYWYPVDIDDKEAAAIKIADLPLCVVEVDGETGLALTGGGMDMSWDIAEAFIRLGFYPPAHFADLPRFAGGVRHAKQIVEAMKESVDFMLCQYQYNSERLAGLAQWAQENDRSDG